MSAALAQGEKKATASAVDLGPVTRSALNYLINDLKHLA